MFTKDQISKMKEEEFQNKVLIPLFRKMNFHDVTAFGGGPLELGKDIVMWKQGDVEERVNYGVVVKAVRISGKAKGKDSASEVLNQVRQCLTSEYPDPVTAQKQKIQKCFVVSSQIIEKGAINSIESQLRDFHFDKLVVWIHPGTNLYQLIEKHLPKYDIFENLSLIQKELDESTKDTPYRIVADSTNKFSFLLKHEKAAEEMPFNINGKFKFDKKTAEGRKALKKFQDHFKKGVPVEIDGKFIESFDFPDFLPSWMKPGLMTGAKLLLTPHPVEQKHPFQVKFEGSSKRIKTLEYIELQITQPGQEEITLSNKNQDVPWQFSFTFIEKKKKANFNYHHKIDGLNVYQQLQCLEFLELLEEGGEIQLKSLDTGLDLYKSQLPPAKKKQVSLPYIDLLKKLVVIQNKTSILLSLGKNNVTEGEAQEIFFVEKMMESGKVDLIPDPLAVRFDIKQAKEIYESFAENNSKRLIFKSESPVETIILGNKINLGHYVYLSGAYVDTEQLNFLREKTSDEPQDDHVEFRLNIKDKQVTAYFLDWLSAEELEALKERFNPEIMENSTSNVWLSNSNKENGEVETV